MSFSEKFLKVEDKILSALEEFIYWIDLQKEKLDELVELIETSEKIHVYGKGSRELLQQLWLYD